jgi:hypothetical protein
MEKTNTGPSLCMQMDSDMEYFRMDIDLILQQHGKRRYSTGCNSGFCGFVARVVEEAGIGSILCLQMDSDMEYFDLDIDPIIARCKERGDIKHMRYQIRDFDPFDLRLRLAGAVAIVKREIDAGRKIYIHCTAGGGFDPRPLYRRRA